MAEKTIFTIGFELPTDKFEYISIESNRTLADADIILIEAKLTSNHYSDHSKCKIYTRHWFNEIITAYKAGKTIFIYLPTRSTISNLYDRDTVDSFENIIPMKRIDSENKRGQKVKFTKEGKLLTNYWSIAGSMSNYEVTFDFDATPLLMTNDNSNIVGEYLTYEDNGTMFFLPPIKLPEDFKSLLKWSNEAEQFGHKFFKEIIALDKIIKSTGKQSQKPDWLYEEEYLLKKENECNMAIGDKEEAIKKLQEEIMVIQGELEKATIPKQLLYETGITLEKAIIYGLRLIGFEANNYQDDESEFDIVFSSPDTCRFLGESEGKDNKAINADKYRQLTENLEEDFHKEDGNDEYAKGVLFGNGYRLIEPSKREDGFTNKVQISAKRSGISLVNTANLFKVVKYIQDTNDENYAKKVRECFRDSEGVEIEFPAIPS